MSFYQCHMNTLSKTSEQTLAIPDKIINVVPIVSMLSSMPQHFPDPGPKMHCCML